MGWPGAFAGSNKFDVDLPDHWQTIVILGDHKASDAIDRSVDDLRKRYPDRQIIVIRTPDPAHDDWNELLQASGPDAVKAAISSAVEHALTEAPAKPNGNGVQRNAGGHVHVNGLAAKDLDDDDAMHRNSEMPCANGRDPSANGTDYGQSDAPRTPYDAGYSRAVLTGATMYDPNSVAPDPDYADHVPEWLEGYEAGCIATERDLREQANQNIVTRRIASLANVGSVEWPCTTSDGSVRKDWPENLDAFLATAGLTFRRNELTQDEEIVWPSGEHSTLADPIIDAIAVACARRGFAIKKDWCDTIVRSLAASDAYHPVLDWLDRLVWDGTPRLDRWLTIYAGADDTPLHRAFASKTLIASVNRAARPGCKKDEMLILEGPQGGGKSSLISTLFGSRYFTDSVPLRTGGRDMIDQMRGKIVGEVAELSTMRAAAHEHLKAELSRQTDRAREVYKRRSTEAPRQFILIGTTNDDKYLSDQTGNRRYWPVKVGAVDLGQVRRDRDQLWAEAYCRAMRGETHTLDPSLWAAAAEAQGERVQDDAWADRLAGYLRDAKGIVARDTLFLWLDIPPERWGGGNPKKLAEAMRQLGWQHAKRRSPGVGRQVSCFTNTPDTNAPWISPLKPDDETRH